jgi:N-methylhydantoinase A/oxoprolinase/acetone carboxylase beta subunit
MKPLLSQRSHTMKSIGVDVGGTFTDLVLINEETGEIFSNKVPSTPLDPSLGTMNGVVEICNLSSLRVQEIDQFHHGTTVATNTIVEHQGAKTGLIITEGFRDIIQIARQKKPLTYTVQIEPIWQKYPLVERRYRIPVRERIGAPDGEVLIPLNEEDVRRAIKILKEEEVGAISVCFINSYLNPIHEIRVGELLSELYPEAYVSLSHKVINQYREFERFNTTCLNSYIGPKVSKYIKNLEIATKNSGMKAFLRLIQSSGGTATASWGMEKPASLLMSGPVAGLIAGIRFGELAGFSNLITLDMGGTTTEIGVAPSKEIRYKHLYRNQVMGYQMMLPMVDVESIGAGGGSIAYIDEGGVFRVGPQSAGTYPGPACYGRGGNLPTVTDAHLLLGRLNPNYFLGGKIGLNIQRSQQAFEEIRQKLTMKVEETAFGILEIIHHNVIQAIEMNSTRRGYDPREFTLVAFGGAGPLHACSIAQELEIPNVVIPPLPGITSAIGLLLSDVSYDYSRTVMQVLSTPNLNQLNQLFSQMEQEAHEQLKRDGFKEDHIKLKRIAECRYMGQSYELRVPFNGGRVTKKSVDKLIGDFNTIHKKEYGITLPEQVEMVYARVLGIGKLHPPQWEKIAKGGRDPKHAFKYKRPVFFSIEGKRRKLMTPCFERSLLKAGNMIKGPAILEQPDSTTVILPELKGEVDGFGNLLIRIR